MPCYCAVPNCINSSKAAILHVFPKNQQVSFKTAKGGIQIRENYIQQDVIY